MFKNFIIICTIVVCVSGQRSAYGTSKPKPVTTERPDGSSYPVYGRSKQETDTTEKPDKSSYPVYGRSNLETETTERPFRFLVNPVEGFNPCSDTRALFMQREIGRPVNEDNYWDGYLDLEKFGTLKVVNVELRLKAPATVTVQKEDGGVWYDAIENAYYIILTQGTDGRVGNFHVQGPPRGEFPQLAELYLNGRNICPNPEPWPSSYVRDRTDTNSESKCGRRIVKHRKLITNGFLTQEGQWPWHAGIFHINIRSKASSYNCGGTLISSKFVITAGHCVIESSKVMTPERILVRLGQHNRLFVDANTEEYRLFDIFLHEDYRVATLENDIALLKLATDVQFTDYIQPACLWEHRTADLSYVVGKRGYIIGWGYNEEDTLSDVLMQARMPVVSFHTCLDSNRPFFSNYLSPLNFCAGYRNGTGACNGDSGSGMFFRKNNIYWLRGIVSLSPVRKDKNLCDPREYVLFTDVAQYLDWIEPHLNEGKSVEKQDEEEEEEHEPLR